MKQIKEQLHRERASLEADRLRDQPRDYSQMYYEGAIKCLNEYPVDGNIIESNHWISEKRVECRRHRPEGSDYWLGYWDALDIICEIRDKELYGF